MSRAKRVLILLLVVLAAMAGITPNSHAESNEIQRLAFNNKSASGMTCGELRRVLATCGRQAMALSDGTDCASARQEFTARCSPTASQKPTATPNPPALPSGDGETKTQDTKPSCDDFRGSNGRVCEAASAGSFLVGLLEKNLSNQTMFLQMNASKEWLKPYAISFGLGAIILAITLMQGIAMSADGKSVSGWRLLSGVGLRAYIYFPAMMIAPALVAALSAMTNEMAESLMGEAGTSMIHNLNLIFEAFVNPIQALNTIAFGGPGSGVVALLLCLILVVISLLALLIEVTVVQFSTYLLAVLLPVGIALSISPKLRKVGTGIISGLAAVLLIKPAIWLALWVGGTVLSGTLEQSPEGILGSYTLQQLASIALTLAVLLISAAAVPLLAPSVLKWFFGGAAQAWSRPQMPGLMRYASQRGVESGLYSGSRALRRASQSGRPGVSGSKPARSKSSSPVSGAKRAAASESASAAAGTSAAGGPITAFLSVVRAGWNKFQQAVGRSRQSVDSTADHAGSGGNPSGEHVGEQAAGRNPRGGSPGGNGRPDGVRGGGQVEPRREPNQADGGRQTREPKDEPPKGGGI